ncbi:MAG: GNAT family N-acetyltransferase [Janthinobacterium lividum]
MELLVREATDNDADLLARLTRSCWFDRIAPTSSGHAESAAKVALQLQRGGGYVLLVDEQPAGSVRWLPLETETGVWEILRMGVLPAHRGARLSQHLLEAVLHRAQVCEINELRLAVRTDQTRLLGLYAAFGFDLAPELEYSNANPLEPAPIVMRRLLRR